MMTYILLRNNKESAPLTLEQLRNADLKSHDLVWVEGQSVCWQNPGEIRELKDLVNGQPLQVTSKVITPVTPLAEKEEINRFVSPQEDVLNVKNENPVKEQITQIAETPVKEFNHVEIEFPDNTKIPIYDPKEEHAIVFPNNKGSYSLNEKKVEPETKYSRPLDELKELYAKNLEQRMKKDKFSFNIPPQVKKAALYVGLIAAGIVVGILLNNSGSRKNVASTQTVEPSGEIPRNRPVEPVQTSLTENNTGYSEPVNTGPVAEERPYPENRREETYTKSKAKKVQPEVTNTESDDVPAEPAEKTNREPEEAKTTRELSANEMRSMVSVETNNYKVGSFGGIRDLKLTVTNTSRFNIDHVLVELKYLKPGDELLKSEHISFYSIGANDSKTLAVPKSNRGVKVSYKVIRVESKEISSTTAGL